jgi:nucleoside phosphorylase
VAPFEPRFPGKVFAGTPVLDSGHAIEIAVAFGGKDPKYHCDRIGTEAAVLASYALWMGFRPDIFINAGTCGGFTERGGSVGDVYVGSKEFLFHGRPIPLPEFTQFGIGRIPALDAQILQMKCDLKPGVISSSNGFTTDEDERAFFTSEHVDVKDMEASALARLFQDLDTPFLAIKAVTDLIDAPQAEEEAFLKNYTFVCGVLKNRLLSILNCLTEPGNSMSTAKY